MSPRFTIAFNFVNPTPSLAAACGYGKQSGSGFSFSSIRSSRVLRSASTTSNVASMNKDNPTQSTEARFLGGGQLALTAG